MLDIIEVQEEYKDQWNAFVAQNALDGGLLQSWQWGEFQKSYNNRPLRIIGLNAEGEIQLAMQVIRYELPFEYTYLYAPRGPVVTEKTTLEDLQAAFDLLKEKAKEDRNFMIRLDPAWPADQSQTLLEMGLRKSEAEIQPKCTLLLDITPDEETLLAQMKQKTRYNINLAQKKGVSFRWSDDSTDLEHFWQLMKQTSERDGFHSHEKEYYKKMFEILNPGQTLRIGVAEFQGKIVAAALVSFFGTTAVYLHGASANLFREVMAPYLVQWEGILEAKRRGCVCYDFGGLNGPSYQNEKWEGITRFKTGFGGEQKITEFVGAHELVTNPFVFSAYKFIKEIRG